MNRNEAKKYLTEKLKAEHCFWSYEEASIQDVPDDILIEKVLLHLDLDDIKVLFDTYPYKTIKKAWIERLIPQNNLYYTLNLFFSWYYFKAKKPEAYIKAMETRQLNKISRMKES